MDEVKRIFIHIRWPLQSFTLLGFLFSLVICKIPFSSSILIQFISWLFLCAGITVYNSYYDKDTHPVAGLENPPPTSKTMLLGAYTLKLLGLLLALSLKNMFFIILYLLIVLLSVLYSHDSFRFKSNGYVAVFFNWIIGISTFLVPTLLGSNNFYTIAFGGFSSGFFLSSIYLMMQVHQHKEDRQRNDRSIMVMYGRKVTLGLAMISLVIAGILSFVALLVAHFSYQYFLILVLYFSLVIVFSFIWLLKKGSSMTDFKIMNRLTLRISYSTNALLMAIYVYEVILRSSR